MAFLRFSISGAYYTLFLHPHVESNLDRVVQDMSQYPHAHTWSFVAPLREDSSPRWLSAVTSKLPASGALPVHKLVSVIQAGLTTVPPPDILRTEADRVDVDIPDATMIADEDTQSIHTESSAATCVDSPSPKRRRTIDWLVLQRHFKAMVIAGCRPGYISTCSTTAISVSIPAVFMLEVAHPRVLLTWDKKLREPNQHVTVVVSHPAGAYPPLGRDGSCITNESPRFRVGLTPAYKPSMDDQDGAQHDDIELPRGEDYPNLQRFDMAHILEDLLNGDFLSILRLRIQYRLSWAGAEVLHFQLASLPLGSNPFVLGILESLRPHIQRAESEEVCTMRLYTGLPLEPSCVETALDQPELNLPLVAFAYILRRLMLTGRFCLICHKLANRGTEPYQQHMCDPALCSKAPRRAVYEICANPEKVDLLVSLTYIAANALGLDPRPTGLGLRVPTVSASTGIYTMADYDQLPRVEMCTTVRDLIACLPSVGVMKTFLESTSSASASPDGFRLPEMDRSIPAAAWTILRWCFASCRMRIDALHRPEEMVQNVGSEWRQFRISLGIPEAEHRFHEEVQLAQSADYTGRARLYPWLYAFHGSPLDSWHSILRYGLWYKSIRHGRRYGNGIYLAKDPTIAERYAEYASPACQWPNSACVIEQCMTLAEVVNQPARFVYDYATHGGGVAPTHVARNIFVVGATEWVLCRYLFVKSKPLQGNLDVLSDPASAHWQPVATSEYVRIDPLHPLVRFGKVVAIPDYMRRLVVAVRTLRAAYKEGAYDEVDTAILSLVGWGWGDDVGEAELMRKLSLS
ncbi:hypothetical protein C8Q76DRAFT_801607 [Earliella scabrosa]|nr:hypothetical protein C8Q76DRAFT_801607 [Earliella scabrosa]